MTNRHLIIIWAIVLGIPVVSIGALLGTAWYIEHLRIMDAKPAFDPLVPLGVTVCHNSLPFYRQAEYIAEFSARSQLSDDNVSVLTCLTTLPENNRLDLFIETPKITDASVPHLKKLHNLASLALIGTSVSDQGVAELQKALPTTTVVRRQEPRFNPSYPQLP